jgi:hypothetical protein
LNLKLREFEYLGVDNFATGILYLQILASGVQCIVRLVNTSTEDNMTEPSKPNDEADENQGPAARRPVDTARVGKRRNCDLAEPRFQRILSHCIRSRDSLQG